MSPKIPKPVLDHPKVTRLSLQVANVSSILARHPEALIAGAPFPDYLYACGTDHGAGRTPSIFNICIYLPSALPLGECNKRDFGNCPVIPQDLHEKRGFHAIPCFAWSCFCYNTRRISIDFTWIVPIHRALRQAKTLIGIPPMPRPPSTSAKSTAAKFQDGPKGVVEHPQDLKVVQGAKGKVLNH